MFSSLIFSQTTEKKPLGKFSELKVFSFLNVELIKSTTNKIEVFGNNAEDVSVTQINNALKIRLPLDKYFSKNDVLIKVYLLK